VCLEPRDGIFSRHDLHQRLARVPLQDMHTLPAIDLLPLVDPDEPADANASGTKPTQGSPFEDLE
jgi:hypothetical protein